MIKKVTIGKTVFIAQTVYFIYRSEEDLQNDEQPFLRTSDKELYETYLKEAKEKNWELLPMDEAKEKYGYKK